MLSLLIFVVGLAVLIGGADLLIRGVSGLAAAAGVPQLVIGLTVVAFGTSTPELVVNVMAASHGQTELAFGNIVGACTVNIGLVLALTALIRPLTVEPSIITRELPMVLLAVAAIVVLSEDSALGTRTADTLDRSDGLALLLFFSVFLYYTVMQVVLRRSADAFVTEVRQSVAERPAGRHKTWLEIVMLLSGLAGVAVGGRMTVGGAVGIATALGIPEVIIGLTLVSLGTTAPELATCILAARRGQGDIAIGNVVGSNIFNLLFIGGLVATVRPVPIPRGGQLDLLFMAGLSVVLLPIAIRGPRRILRSEAGLLLGLYVGYVLYRTLGRQSA